MGYLKDLYWGTFYLLFTSMTFSRSFELLFSILFAEVFYRGNQFNDVSEI